MHPKQLDILADVIIALKEDLGSGDVSSALISANIKAYATIITREPLLVCGIQWCTAVFKTINPGITLEWLVQEGSWIAGPTILCKIYGDAKDVLTAERTALNFLQTLSGTATKTYSYIQIIQGTSTKILDTRKTLPGLRLAQKYAVACAGGYNHRFGLYDAYLIKENHIQACGSITNAVLRARKANSKLFLEIEVQNLTEFDEAMRSKPDRILLDNFSIYDIQQAISMNTNYNYELEASGGINLMNIAAFAATGIHWIAIGDLTKSVRAIDLSLLIEGQGDV
ncbi:MAG: nicotinate-nucleotide diphosphorylase (carboxylating) [Legionellales bacterium RIFCSPHIGHO2_12_FULL_42_9]|nr:MAG: nicotinate-nucleotide diphosphorylase (carboxylating) [Legionellales bacterium RIFCSPHIGHO2_12_FULL_42_9]